MSEEDRLKTNNEKVTINDYYYYYLLKCENILNELEKYINNEWNAIEKEPDNSFYDGYDTCIEEMKKDILDKIKELKGSNNNE